MLGANINYFNSEIIDSQNGLFFSTFVNKKMIKKIEYDLNHSLNNYKSVKL